MLLQNHLHKNWLLIESLQKLDLKANAISCIMYKVDAYLVEKKTFQKLTLLASSGYRRAFDDHIDRQKENFWLCIEGRESASESNSFDPCLVHA